MPTYQPTRNIETDKAVYRDWQNLQSCQLLASIFIGMGSNLKDWRDEMRIQFVLSASKCELTSAGSISCGDIRQA